MNAELLENIAAVFENHNKKKKENNPDLGPLYIQIRTLKVVNEFIKKAMFRKSGESFTSGPRVCP